MGSEEEDFGEVASDTAINKLKEWFEGLTEEQRKCFQTGVVGLKNDLQEKIERDIQIEVENATHYLGGTTLVCAIIGEKDTLIANIGDSRAYIIKDGKLKQISREDTLAHRMIIKGILPNKEVARFYSKSNIITQCIGMSRKDLNHPNIEIINNSDYDMLLLFSDGVTNCYSEKDIAVVCKNSNKKEVARIIVEKALKKDEFAPEEYLEDKDIEALLLGGKDNASIVIDVPERE